MRLVGKPGARIEDIVVFHALVGLQRVAPLAAEYITPFVLSQDALEPLVEDQVTGHQFAHACAVFQYLDLIGRWVEGFVLLDPHYESSTLLPYFIGRMPRHGYKLRKYDRETKLDLDEAIISQIKKWGAPGAAIVLHATGNNLQATTAILSPVVIRNIFENVWTFLVDPKAD